MDLRPKLNSRRLTKLRLLLTLTRRTTSKGTLNRVKPKQRARPRSRQLLKKMKVLSSTIGRMQLKTSLQPLLKKQLTQCSQEQILMRLTAQTLRRKVKKCAQTRHRIQLQPRKTPALRRKRKLAAHCSRM